MAGKLNGEVISIDAAGNLVTDIRSSQLEDVPRDERVLVSCDGHKTFGIFPSHHAQPELTFLAVLGDDKQLQLIMVGESAHDFLGIQRGSKVVITWS